MGERKGERYGGEIGRTPLNFARQAASVTSSPFLHTHGCISLYFTNTTGKNKTCQYNYIIQQPSNRYLLKWRNMRDDCKLGPSEKNKLLHNL